MAIILEGLHEIADGYDALICDVWGVLHDGGHAHGRAVDALQRFRAGHGPVVLLSNAPRPVSVLEEQFAQIGVPSDCYDAIVTSGVAARAALEMRAGHARLAILHIGPERDRGVFEGVAVDCVDAARASIVLCTGPYDDEVETPQDYRGMFGDLKQRGLTLLCANPDIVVQRGGKLIYCAGALARLYEEMGGEVVYYGKPYAPIYETTLAAARQAAGRAIMSPLAVGDGLETDIRGANLMGIDALFIADGIHGEDIPELTAKALEALTARNRVVAQAASRALVW
jgi:HAD superfamily hydrolase (TIGR01459 family)